MIQCLFFDLDGTLITPEDKIEEYTYKRLKEVMAKGVEVVFATGRDINMVIDIMDAYDLDVDLILNNGTQYRNRSGSVNEYHPMSDENFIKIATILNDAGYLLAIHTNEGKYGLCSADEFWDRHLALLHKNDGMDLPEKTFTVRERFMRDYHPASSPQEIVGKGVKVLKIDARHMDLKDIAGIRAELNIPGLDISSSYEDNMEITSNEYNKGKMVDHVIGLKGYGPEEIAIFGDGLNDVPMLEKYRYSFTPANGSLEAREYAHFILRRTNVEGAVGEALDKLGDMKLI